jgi:hypothetical protein
MHKEKIKTYILTIFSWGFLSFALYKLTTTFLSSYSFLSVIALALMYFLYLFYLWIRIKSRPAYLVYLINSFFYVGLIIGFRYLYHIVFILRQDNEFDDIGYVFLGLFLIIGLSCSAFYWIIRFFIKIFSK